jgi:hypothetical protein
MYAIGIENLLLILESVLLIFTIILLLYSIKEGKHRDALLTEVGRATRILTRQEYFLAITDAMLGAEGEVLGAITGRLPAKEDNKRILAIVDHIEKLVSKGIHVAYLIPKFPDRLKIGHHYTKAGAEVRYSSCLMVQDLRYTIVDHKQVVLGIPERRGNDKDATKKGYSIPSEGLASMLEENFHHCWESSPNFEEYVREILHETGASPKLLAREFQIDEKELERIAR